MVTQDAYAARRTRPRTARQASRSPATPLCPTADRCHVRGRGGSRPSSAISTIRRRATSARLEDAPRYGAGSVILLERLRSLEANMRSTRSAASARPSHTRTRLRRRCFLRRDTESPMSPRPSSSTRTPTVWSSDFRRYFDAGYARTEFAREARVRRGTHTALGALVRAEPLLSELAQSRPWSASLCDGAPSRQGLWLPRWSPCSRRTPCGRRDG